MLEIHHSQDNESSAPARTATSRGRAEPRPIPAAAVSTVRFILGEWLVDTSAHALQRDDERVAIEPRQMAVLAALCRHPGDVMSAEALLDLCWPGQAVGDNPVHKAIASLRRALRDSATAPQYIETVRKQGYRLVAPARAVSADTPRAHEGGWQGTSPFRGLEAFGARHASVFFGRDDSVTLLRACLGEQWRRGHGLVLLLGASGSGKTSLVNAGLLPAMLARPLTRLAAEPAMGFASLKACTTATVDLGAHDETGAWGALAGGMLDWDLEGVPLLPGYSIATLAAELKADPDRVLRALRLALETCAEPAYAAEAPPLLVLDRLEALFQEPLADEATAFVAGLEPFVRSGLVILLGVCRNDFYSSIAAHRLFMQGKPFGGHMDLGPPDAEALAQIVRLPARVAGLSYSMDPTGMHRLDDRLCADAMRAPDALPLLQYTLQSLYLARAPGDLLTWEAYDALDGLEGAVGQRAEAVIAALPPRQQQALTKLLPRLVGWTAGEPASTGRWMRDSEFGGEDEAALAQALVDARLLVADRVAGAAGVRIAHEALLRRWPRVTTWIAQHRAMLAIRDELQPWVRQWRDSARAQALLLPRGLALWRIVGAVAQAPDLFSAEERDFVNRSQGRVKRQTQLRWAAAGGVVLLAAVAGVMAYRNARLAQIASEREMQSHRLISFMLGDLADQLRPIGKLDLLNSVGEQGWRLLSPGGTRTESPADALQRAKAMVVIGEVNSTRGTSHADTALAALHEARRLLEPLEHADGVEIGDYYKTLGASEFWLGQIAFDSGDFALAAQHMARYRETCERWLRAAPDDARARTEFGFAVSSLGSVAVKRGAWAEATRWFESSLALKQAALASHPTDVDMLDAVASSRTWLGQLAHVQGQLTKALALYDDALAVRVDLMARRPSEFARLRDLGVLEVRRSEALQALGRHALAEAGMADAVDRLAQATSHDPSNVRWQAERLHAESAWLLARLDAGLPAGDGLREIQRQLGEKNDPRLTNDFLWRETQARVSVVDAEIAAREGDWPRASRATAEASDRLLALLKLRPWNWQDRELQARLGLLGMRQYAAHDQAAHRTDLCVRLREQLQSAVDSGQAGLVLEAWLLAKECSGSGAVDAGSVQRLTAGGYLPTSSQFLPPLKPKR